MLHRPLGSRSPAPLTVAIASFAVVLSGCGGVVELAPGDPVAFVQQPQTSKILAPDGTVLADLHAEQDREEVGLDEVSPHLLHAVVSVEDRRFFLHAGVDAAAIARAAVANVAGGGIEQGGSTLTQQYVKNTMTGPARTLERKVKEAVLAFQLEQSHTKDEILERYLNTVYFGRGAYGIRAASQRFFAVEPADLTLPQAATLAGMIASPSRFDPHTEPEASRQRRRIVLDAMVETGQLDASEAAEAAEHELTLAPIQADSTVVAPYFIEEVKRQIQHDPEARFAVLGDTVDERASRLFTGGLRVTTTLDPRIQSIAEQATAELLPDPGPSAAVVVTEPETGAVRAIVGGRDFYAEGDPNARFNLATQGRRQPGSSFKPLVLATALSRGISLDRRFPGGACAELPRIPGWEDGVCNYGGTNYGDITLREATVKSVNTVYARLAAELGPTTLLATAQTLGLRGLPEVHSLALGSGEVTPIGLAGAYSAFATLGRYAPPHLIERIETADGELLWEHDGETYQVFDPAVSYLVTQTLTDVVRRGTGIRARIDRPQAGKTGTSQDSADAWFVGYTPQLLAAVWVGFPEGRVPMTPPNTAEVIEGGRLPADIWRRVMGEALAEVPPSPFPVPDVELIQVEVDGTRNCLPNPYTPAEVIERRPYLRGTEPTEQCTEPTGPPIDNVPRVVGLPLDVAQRLLEDKGFVVESRPVASRRYPPGIVSRQRPEPGGTTLASDDNAVVLWVSTTSRSRIEVPLVVGFPAGQAVETLEAAGWVPEVVLRCPADGCDGLRPGEVWAQDPPAGDREREFSVVTLDVAPPR